MERGGALIRGGAEWPWEGRLFGGRRLLERGRLFEERRNPYNPLTLFCAVRQAKVVCATELTSI